MNIISDRSEHTDISIMFVEDDPDTRELMIKYIELKFPENKLYSPENGQEGLDIFQKYHPDIILTDIKMPYMDGIQMTKKIRKLDPSAYVIALTAYGDSLKEMSDDTEPLFDQILQKPIMLKQVCTVIEECIDKIAP